RHRRTWRCSHDSVVIVDEVRGSGRHRARAFLHFAPTIVPTPAEGGGIEAGPVEVIASGAPAPEVSLVESAVSRGFGQLDHAAALVAASEAELPLKLEVTVAVRPVSTIGRDEPAEGAS